MEQLLEYRTAECILDWIDFLAFAVFHLSLDEDCNTAEHDNKNNKIKFRRSFDSISTFVAFCAHIHIESFSSLRRGGMELVIIVIIDECKLCILQCTQKAGAEHTL